MIKIIYISILILSFFNVNSFACSCIGESTVKQSVKSSDGVLVGEIISREEISFIDSGLNHKYSNFHDLLIVKYQFVIEEIYKGKYKSDTISVYTGTGKGDCGFGFKIGEKYILYGRKKSGFVNNELKKIEGRNIMWTSICTRTKPYNEEEINEIRKYKKGKK